MNRGKILEDGIGGDSSSGHVKINGGNSEDYGRWKRWGWWKWM
jgi:hypothetical protein